MNPITTTDSNHLVPTSPLVAFLERLQETALCTYGNINFDPKLYVDLSLKHDLSVTEFAFDELVRFGNRSVSPNKLDVFIGEYFDDAGNDLEYHEPDDFVAEPDGFLAKVENLEVRAWALEVHALWKNLSRKVSASVSDRPDMHTLLPLSDPVMIPGSRFREVYYWDSYWVIRGLLAGKMYVTAKAIVNNLISLVERYGYVLNGARAYYTNRSQPPLLSSMINEIYNRTGDIELLKKSLPALVKEHQFWNTGIHLVTIKDFQAVNHKVSRYYAMWNKPRPESSTIDKESASKFLSASDKQQFYLEIASAAESGWDFSTRWMRDPSDFTTLATTSVLPVDLNIFLLKMELDIAVFAKATGENSIAKRFLEASKLRHGAINSIFWNEGMGQWLDYWQNSSNKCKESQTWEARNQNRNVFASNFVPLWIDLFNSDEMVVKKVMKSLQSSDLLRPAGIATSLKNSGQQWLLLSTLTFLCILVRARNLLTPSAIAVFPISQYLLTVDLNHIYLLILRGVSNFQDIIRFAIQDFLNNSQDFLRIVCNSGFPV